MTEESRTGSISIYFELPNRRIITRGNIYTGSENTFNYRLKSDKDAGRIHLWVWYGMKCFELSEPVSEHEEDDSEEGYTALVAELDSDYDIYRAALEKGEVQGRPTYLDHGKDSKIMSEYEMFSGSDKGGIKD